MAKVNGEIAVDVAKESTSQEILGAVGNGMVKSVQRGVITIPKSAENATATINAVDTTKAVVLYGGYSTGVATNGNSHNTIRLTLANPTTLTANREATSSYAATVAYQVIEYY